MRFITPPSSEMAQSPPVPWTSPLARSKPFWLCVGESTKAEDQRVAALVRYGINPRFNQRGSGVEPVACDDSDL